MKISETAVVLLAGGNSSRTSIPKGLIRVKGKSWIKRQVQDLNSLGVKKVIVVTGIHSEVYASALEGVSCILVKNENPEYGPFSSIQIGLQKLSPEILGVFILPLDTPVVEKNIWNEMAEAIDGPIDGKKYSAVKVQVQDRGGHPVLLSRIFSEELLKRDPIHPNSRLDLQLHALALVKELCVIRVLDDGILLNMNHDKDYSRYHEQHP